MLSFKAKQSFCLRALTHSKPVKKMFSLLRGATRYKSITKPLPRPFLAETTITQKPYTSIQSTRTQKERYGGRKRNLRRGVRRVQRRSGVRLNRRFQSSKRAPQEAYLVPSLASLSSSISQKYAVQLKEKRNMKRKKQRDPYAPTNTN